MKRKLTEQDIRDMWEKVGTGTTVKEITEKYGISREWYYKKCSELGLETQKEIKANINIEEIEKIKDINDLSKLLDIDVTSVYKYSNPNKDAETNKKRMSYLKNHSPDKFQEAVYMTILNFYNVSPVKLIKLLKLIN